MNSPKVHLKLYVTTFSVAIGDTGYETSLDKRNIRDNK
jgi:hypothetical protein